MVEVWWWEAGGAELGVELFDGRLEVGETIEFDKKREWINIETMSIHVIPAFPVHSLLSVQYFRRTPSIARTKPPTVCFHTSNRIEPSPLLTTDTHH